MKTTTFDQTTCDRQNLAIPFKLTRVTKSKQNTRTNDFMLAAKKDHWAIFLERLIFIC